MLPWRCAAVLICCLFSLPTAARPVTTAGFKGTAHVGAATRDIVVRFSCAMVGSKINNLAIALDVPAAESLKPTFNFDAFEGPTGIGGKHRLVATAGATDTQMDFAGTGSYGNNGAPATTFTFNAAMTPDARLSANLEKLQAVVRTLASGASHLVYTVANPLRGGPALEATVDLSDADAGLLRSAMSKCRGTRP
jgi:acetylornithine deacetylase/succinyl-diaminopimelate desuccinylase-like protein